MDGVSIAASLVGIGAAGCQIAIKLYTLATQISTASERISSISNDVSLTSSVLQQLGELMTQKAADDGTTIFSRSGLETTKTSAAMCEAIFKDIEQAAREASKQIRGRSSLVGGKIKLSKSEKAKWPFLQPSIETLRNDLREAKGTLMLMLQVTSLGLSKKMADIHQTASARIVEQREIIGAILALQQQQQANPNPKSKRLSMDRSSNCTPRPESRKSLDKESSWPDEDETLAQPSAFNSVKSLPMRPNVLMTLPDQNLPAPTTSMKRSTSNDTESSTSEGCAIENRKENDDSSMQSVSNQSLRGGCVPTPSETTLDGDKRKITALDLFLMKPEIRDLADMIQLSWKTHKVQMQQAEIQKQVIKNREEGLPAVFEVCQDLYTHEHKAVEDEISKAGAHISLISLKRTHVDMWHREIFFKDVPGLQFVLERDIQHSIRPELAHEAYPWLANIRDTQITQQVDVSEVEARNGSVAKGSLFHLDTDLDNMEGILDPNIKPASLSHGATSVAEPISEEPQKGAKDRYSQYEPGEWDAPDSWAIKSVGDENITRLQEIDGVGQGQPCHSSDRSAQTRYITDDNGMLRDVAGSDKVARSRPAQVVINNSQLDVHSPPHTSRSQRGSSYEDDSWDVRAYSPRRCRDRVSGRSRHRSKERNGSRGHSHERGQHFYRHDKHMQRSTSPYGDPDIEKKMKKLAELERKEDEEAAYERVKQEMMIAEAKKAGTKKEKEEFRKGLLEQAEREEYDKELKMKMERKKVDEEDNDSLARLKGMYPAQGYSAGNISKSKLETKTQSQQSPMSPATPVEVETENRHLHSTERRRASMKFLPDSLGSKSLRRKKIRPLRLEPSKPISASGENAFIASLVNARFIRCLTEVPYPKGIVRPRLDLYTGRLDGAFRYDIVFLLQFQTVVLDTPAKAVIQDLVSDPNQNAKEFRRPRRGDVGIGAAAAINRDGQDYQTFCKDDFETSSSEPETKALFAPPISSSATGPSIRTIRTPQDVMHEHIAKEEARRMVHGETEATSTAVQQASGHVAAPDEGLMREHASQQLIPVHIAEAYPPSPSDRPRDKRYMGGIKSRGAALDDLKYGSSKPRKRTKTGCLTCRHRRIRCGEERPSCNNCIKSKRTCEDYTPPAIFKDPMGAPWPAGGTLSYRSHTQIVSKSNFVHSATADTSPTPIGYEEPRLPLPSFHVSDDDWRLKKRTDSKEEHKIDVGFATEPTTKTSSISFGSGKHEEENLLTSHNKESDDDFHIPQMLDPDSDMTDAYKPSSSFDTGGWGKWANTRPSPPLPLAAGIERRNKTAFTSRDEDDEAKGSDSASVDEGRNMVREGIDEAEAVDFNDEARAMDEEEVDRSIGELSETDESEGEEGEVEEKVMDEQEAERVVRALLGKYTTLFQ
ncbi:MAG: hypothetical protein Q9179_004046 [Wetmoreana sp. 5 TL-2023]